MHAREMRGAAGKLAEKPVGGSWLCRGPLRKGSFFFRPRAYESDYPVLLHSTPLCWGVCSSGAEEGIY
jgi:hypothetical protein